MSGQPTEAGGQRGKLRRAAGRNLVLLGILLGLLFWLVDPVVDSVLLGAPSLREQYFSPEPEEIFVRCFVFALMAGFGLYAQSLVNRRRRAEESANYLAYHDSLTGLPNRALLMDRLALALAQARRSGQMLAVMFLDLDRFKVVNDTLGHAEGDGLVRSVGARLAALLREGDTVARVGGDEFTLLVSGIPGAEGAAEVAERVLADLRRPQVLRGQEFLITVSIGIALYPDDGEDAETLLRNADIAMYRAKEQGRDSYQLFTPAMNARIMERLAWERGLRRALELGEFVVHYQPMANMDTGRIVGVEALVRWQHPERGLIPPGDFIPLAEETGFIVPLGEWVLRTACAQNKAWQQAGLPPVRVAVNLSARQFHLGLVDCVSRVLAETGLEARFLDLEITEGTAMRDPEVTVEVLHQFGEMGIRVSIDDFGSGYSSLSSLKNFPLQSLKIDRGFVRDLASDSNDAAITSAIIAMAHSLKLDVTAEGVETEEQMAFLRQRHCDDFQGFLLARPMPAAALAKMLAREAAPLPAAPGARDRR